MFDTLIFINIVLGILGGILAAAALIVSKKPDAKAMIDKLTPFQAMIGVGLVAVSVINLVRFLPHIADVMKVNLLWAAAFLGLVGSGILLGALFGMPQIAKWIPGDSSAEQKALEISRKVAPFQVLIGLVSIVSSLLVLLYMFKILTLHA
jgi:hypothetical protein